jgi:energy-coupling factor transporter ATP-binding protein EcfA2
MKIRSITLRGYKKFVQEKIVEFLDTEGNVNDKTLILGNNGSGKTTILQAIVIIIASATRDGFAPDSLDWPGFDWRFVKSNRFHTVQVEVEFSEEEISATYDYAVKLKAAGLPFTVLPGKNQRVTLKLDYEQKKVVAVGKADAFFQFSGYQYAKSLSKNTPNKTSLFDSVGNIYWYNEQRNTYALSQLLEHDAPQIDFVRSFLANSYFFHLDIASNRRQLKDGQFDFYARLESAYTTVFPNRKFEGAAPDFDNFEQSSVPDFFLSIDGKQYEISGMSAGERAVFPILMDFTRWNINNSIIIIDEIELHLHPPLQQGLIRALSKLGKNNQFIFTSHSSSVVSMFDESENQIIRLENE